MSGTVRGRDVVLRGLALLTFCAATACSGLSEKTDSSGSSGAMTSGADPGVSEAEVSLKADRSALADERKDIPEETRRFNDEIAGILSFIVRENSEEPSRVRERFNTALRKKREQVDRSLRTKREAFNAAERKSRDEYLKKLKDEREQLTSRRRVSAEERKHFFDDQELMRRDFFADQAEKRKDFESDVQELRKNNEDYIREKQNLFSQEWRAYQQRYTEYRRAEDLKKRLADKARQMEHAGKPVVQPVASSAAVANETQVAAPAPQDPMAEFDKIPSGPGVNLAPGKTGP